MKAQRSRPVLHVTVSREVSEWIQKKARARGGRRGDVSFVVDRLLWDAMDSENKAGMAEERAREDEQRRPPRNPAATARGPAVARSGYEAKR